MKNMKKQLILFILGSVFFTSVFAEAGIYTTIINKSNKQVSVIGSSNSNDWINGSKSGFGQDKVYQINPNDQLMIYSEPKHLTNAYNFFTIKVGENSWPMKIGVKAFSIAQSIINPLPNTKGYLYIYNGLTGQYMYSPTEVKLHTGSCSAEVTIDQNQFVGTTDVKCSD